MTTASVSDPGPICGLCPYTYAFLFANLLTATSPPVGFSALLYPPNPLHSIPSVVRTHRVPISLVRLRSTPHMAQKGCARQAAPEDAERHCRGQFTEFLASQIVEGGIRSSKWGISRWQWGVNTEHLRQGEGHFEGSISARSCHKRHLPPPPGEFILWGLHSPFGFSNAV